MKRPPEVSIEHWTHPRLPADHPLFERWTIMHEGEPRLTFGTVVEAIDAARVNGWTVTRTLTEGGD